MTGALLYKAELQKPAGMPAAKEALCGHMRQGKSTAASLTAC